MAGTLTVSLSKTRTVRKVSLAWTSDAGGAVNATKTEALSGELVRVCFLPGTAGDQPTDLYDVTIEDDDGLDVLAGKGANLSNATKTQIVPLIGDGTTTNRAVYIDGQLELKVTNAGNAKKGSVLVYTR